MGPATYLKNRRNEWKRRKLTKKGENNLILICVEGENMMPGGLAFFSSAL
jgi:hypothetical protein